jgi:cholesterol oxidase
VTAKRETFDRDDSFDALVIGSGFGGSLAAWRLKKECPEKRVLVLERGMPYPPGSFARTPSAMRRNFWDPSDWMYGLFETWSFAHAKVLVSSGLGGGSLIYANVMLEKPASTFAGDRSNGGRPWPIRSDLLAARYPEIKSRLGATVLPDKYLHADPESSAAVPKTQQFLDAAHAAGLDGPQLADLAITFESAQGVEPGAPFGARNANLHGRQRRTCALVGECDAGCNEGAKNSLDYTYLSDFQREGGEIRTCCEAVEISPVKNEYEVRYLQHLQPRARVEARARAEHRQEVDGKLLDPSRDAVRGVRAKVVVLAAGTLGSTRLLLASRAALPRLSSKLGQGFSSNGDLLTFARDCSEVGTERPRQLSPSRGPVITAYARKEVEGQDLWIEDAGGPILSEWGWQFSELLGDLWAMRGTLWEMARGRRRGRVSRDLARGLGSTRGSSAMLPLLGMGRDIPGGQMQLDRDSLSLDWDPAGSDDYYSRLEEAAARVAGGLGGKLGPRGLGKRGRGLTAHPLGGCPMATEPGEGVVGPDGQVFGYERLFVADGSVMPGPIGPNPSLTIAATADHIAEGAAKLLTYGTPAA